jgi:hypothetical protein
VQHFDRTVAVADNQQIGISGLADESWASWASEHLLLYGNPPRPIGGPRQCGRHDLGKFPPGPRFLLGEG